MLKAVLFDLDGVLADTEPLHFRTFQRVLAEEGIALTEQSYYEKYVGLDDKGCFREVLCAQRISANPDTIRRLVDRKAALLLEHLKTDLIFYPGVVELVQVAAERSRLAIVSGALRQEIEYCLDAAGIRRYFEHITAAEDVLKGKPDPEGYLHAVWHLDQKARLSPSECLVIEDTIPGIQAAQAAGMRCLAVSNTVSADELSMAEAVTSSLKGFDLTGLERQLWN